MKVVWTEQALLRLAAIRDYLAARSPDAANETLDRLIERGAGLAQFPRLGRAIPELPGSDLREIVAPPYRIVYRLRGKAVEILTVFEGHLPFPTEAVVETPERRR